MENLQLRLLQPETDLDLYREAFAWRTPKRHISAPEMGFDVFSASDPTHLTFGLFNGELIAVYFLREWERGKFEAHMTSKKGTRVPLLLQGAQVVLDLLLTSGAKEVGALVLPTNKPLRRFLTQLGMHRVSLTLFTCTTELEQCNFDTIQGRNQRQVYVKYAKMKEDTPVGPFRQAAKEHSNLVGHF